MTRKAKLRIAWFTVVVGGYCSIILMALTCGNSVVSHDWTGFFAATAAFITFVALLNLIQKKHDKY